MKARYMINGWRESRSYFMSFRWNTDEIERMIAGETIIRNGNEFSIEVIE